MRLDAAVPVERLFVHAWRPGLALASDSRIPYTPPEKCALGSRRVFSRDASDLVERDGDDDGGGGEYDDAGEEDDRSCGEPREGRHLA